MIQNDVLIEHRKCLEACAEDHDTCEVARRDDRGCDTQLESCRTDCDFYHSP